MSSDIVKIGTGMEAKNQLVIVDNHLGTVITKIQDLDDETKEIRERMRETKDAQRLKEISQMKKYLTVEKIEGIGQRKLVCRMLAKFHIIPPETKLTKLVSKSEVARQLVEA